MTRKATTASQKADVETQMPVAAATASSEAVVAAAEASPTPSEPTHQVDQISVVSRVEGFRRCGRAFGREPVIVSTDEITEAQLRDLIQEPMLVVTFITPEARS